MTLAVEPIDPHSPTTASKFSALGSSWRFRRPVIGGHVLTDPFELARPALHPAKLSLLTILHARLNINIAIHDFWNRSAYQGVLRFLPEIERADRLGAFQIKPDVDRRALEDGFHHAAYQPD